jgi:hypothetical protein
MEIGPRQRGREQREGRRDSGNDNCNIGRHGVSPVIEQDGTLEAGRYPFFEMHQGAHADSLSRLRLFRVCASLRTRTARVKVKDTIRCNS